MAKRSRIVDVLSNGWDECNAPVRINEIDGSYRVAKWWMHWVFLSANEERQSDEIGYSGMLGIG